MNDRLGNLFRLVKKLSAYRLGMGLSILSGTLHHLLAIGIAALGAYMVGLALQGMLGQRFISLVFCLLVFILLRVVMYYAEMWFSHQVAFRLLADFRIMLFTAVERVSPALLLRMRSGQLASTLMSDVELLEWFFAHTFGATLVAILVPLCTLGFMLTLHWLLPFILLFFILLIFFIPFISQEKADKQGNLVRTCLGEANAVTVEGVQGMKEILTLNYREQYQAKNTVYMDRLYQSQIAYGRRLGTEGALLQIWMGLAMVMIMVLAIGLIQQGSLGLEWFPVTVILAAMTFQPILEICHMARNFGLIVAACNRIFAVLEATPVVHDTGVIQELPELRPTVAFCAVSFRYGEDLPLAVENLNFTIQPGEMVALVGSSGAGKSTCMNLLLRYWDVTAGSIQIGGLDLREIALQKTRQLISVVLQEVYLFHISIRENIRLGKPEATEKEVEIAAKAALAHDFILALPEGYATVTGERGCQLSGGQRQRIAIARALLKDSPILILDEAVSNLDTENEQAIQQALRTICRGKTTLVVAHRLSTIMAADRLLVLEEGRIVQSGSHAELIGRPGCYRALMHSQIAFDNEKKT